MNFLLELSLELSEFIDFFLTVSDVSLEALKYLLVFFLHASVKLLTEQVLSGREILLKGYDFFSVLVFKLGQGAVVKDCL